MDSPSPLQQTLDRLRSLSQLDIRSSWRIKPPGSPVPPVMPAVDDQPDWPLAPLNGRGHIAWPQGRQELWLYQFIRWPERLQNYPIRHFQARLALRWWADQADIFVDGERVQSGDLFDCFGRIPLTPSVQPGHGVAVALRLISPGHDPGALVRSQLIFERPDAVLPEPGFVADELAVLATYLQQFSPDRLGDLTARLDSLDWAALPDRGRFDVSLDTVRRWLLPLGASLKQRQITCLGHAHLDMAWLWPVADTWQAAERTFASVLALQQDFPELTYTHSSPALFAWLERHRPDLFAAIQAQVAQGRWFIDAGLWVEPELNLIGGEAIARQILYAQRYCQQNFGAISPVAWLPDSFGFCWQLPQLLRQGEIRCFATQKLRWNDTTAFPYALCRWQGRDGSEILALTLPPIGSDIEPVAMAEYACDWEAQTQRQQCLWLPGVGDHGGGPSRDMLEQARRWSLSPFFPTLRFGSVRELLHSEMAMAPADLPVWSDELYLELHRGCYTTHSDQKWYNRRCEEGLYEAEVLSVLAERLVGYPYPQAALEAAWKQALFNQFHDILPGTAIPEVFAEADRAWQESLQASGEIRQQALAALAAQIPLEPPAPGARPWLVANPLSWDRTELVALPAESPWQVVDHQGGPLSCQPVAAAPAAPQSYPPRLRAMPHQLVPVTVPALGYCVLWQVPAAAPGTPASAEAAWQLENSYLRASVDPSSGDLSHLYDKIRQRQVLSGPGNRLQAFQDGGQYWDAWNLAPDYQDQPLPAARLLELQWIETGPLRQRLRVVRQLAGAQFQQDYVLEAASPCLRIESTVDWQATQVLVKVNFPLALAAAVSTCEIPFGAIERPTRPQTPAEQAKWEVPALRWADLSQADAGVSLLTDAKHGLDFGPSQMRLTLLKSPLWPNPGADRGPHRFTYALYPHGGDWHQGTVQAAIALNQPLRVQPLEPTPGGSLPQCYRGYRGHGGILAALKRAEAGPGYVARFYEPHGQSVPFAVEQLGDLRPQASLNLLETPTGSVPDFLAPWQIQTLALTASHPL